MIPKFFFSEHKAKPDGPEHKRRCFSAFQEILGAPGECSVCVYAPNGASQSVFMAETLELKMVTFENCRRISKNSWTFVYFCLNWLHCISRMSLELKNGARMHV